MLRTRYNKTTFLLAFLCLIAMVIVLYYKNTVNAQEQIMSCPTSKRVPIGSTIDQTVFSLDALLANTQAVINNASQIYQLSGQIITKAELGCNVKNCQSDCTKGTKIQHCDDYPVPGKDFTCPAGYTCTAPWTPYFLKGWDIINSAFGPKQDCKNLPNNLSPIRPDDYYAVFNWGLNFVTHGSCIVDWTCEVPTCKVKDCKNKPDTQICPVRADIQTAIDVIVTDRQAIDGLYVKIDDFFNKKVSEFPIPSGDDSLFGRFCDNELFSMPTCLTSCKATEYHALECLVAKAINNIGLCDIINPNDMLSGRGGEMFFMCKDIEPPPVPNCQPDLYNDFFCCSMEL